MADARPGRRQAIVLGAGFAGLVAARVLADHFDQVVVIERDDLAGEGARRGVPQSHHPHAFLARGHEILQQLFPGLAAELLASGACSAEMLSEVRYVFQGHPIKQVPIGLHVTLASRPFIEARMRRRIQELANVEVRERWELAGITAEGPRVTGARVVSLDTGMSETLSGDLVVDCLGRSGRSSAWLEELGFARPGEERVRSGLTYASGRVRLTGGAPSGDRTVIVTAVAGRARGLVLIEQERGEWMLSVHGYGPGNVPPSDEAGFMEFARDLAPADVRQALKGAQLLGGVELFKVPHSTRRRFDKLRRLPEGLVALGDSLCSFNPVYGAGMTSAAMQALTLGECLAATRSRPQALPRAYFRAASRGVSQPWWFALLADFLLPEVGGKRPFGMPVIRRHLTRTLTAAEHDGQLAGDLFRTIGMVAPITRLVSPRSLLRIYRRR
ncbi:FAD-dependent oxidoreductase [Streptomyces sp. NPDC091268]|uniref:FAD-dependent oxidoreductase n=1 Tax=Streptomyces sp. NPDC091268 TaxID=3365979 RepID=UPI0037FEC07B